MFGLNESTQFYVCQRYVRMNLGINGLYKIVKSEMELPPLGGAVFIFFSKNRQQVKMLRWDGDKLYQGKTPKAMLLNSSYDSSFAAGLLQLRYVYSMPVERIVKYFADNGFVLRKACLL